MKRKQRKRKRLNPSQRRRNKAKRVELQELANSLENEAKAFEVQSFADHQKRLDSLIKEYGSLELVPEKHYSPTTEVRVGKATIRQRMKQSKPITGVIHDGTPYGQNNFIARILKPKGFEFSDTSGYDSNNDARIRNKVRNIENPFSLQNGEIIAVLSEDEGTLYGLDDFGFRFEIVETDEGLFKQWLINHDRYCRDSIYNVIVRYSPELAQCLPANKTGKHDLPYDLIDKVNLPDWITPPA